MTGRAINGVGLTQSYDALGRVTTEVNVLGTFAYTYEGVSGRLATVTYPNAQTSTYSYLPTAQDHRLQTIHHKYPGGATLSKFDYTYDAVGNILTWQQQADSNPAIAWEYGYDEVDQLTAAIKKTTGSTPTVLQRSYYAYDSAGNRTVEQIDEVATWSSYDPQNRLMSQMPGGALRLVGHVNEAATVTIEGRPMVVDAAGRFTGPVAVTSGTNTFTVAATDASGNVRSQQYQVSQAGASKTLAYDANGNLTADGTRTFEWDARNQLVAVNIGAHRSEYAYDGKQRRVRVVEKENSVVQSDTKVIWCQTAICEERAADGIAVVRRVVTDGEQVGGVARFFAGDHLGSVTDVTDTAGGSITRYAFDPWGRRTVTSGLATTKVGFTGHEVTTATGLTLALYRAYDSEFGSWISEDPIRWEEGPNFYRYAAGNPVAFTDPLGLKITCNTSFREQPRVSKTFCGSPGCTKSEFELNLLPCERNPCTNTWKFDAQVTLRLLVEYAVDPTLPSKETPGSTLRQHEMLHVQDLQGWCRSLNNSVKSDGFGSRAACEAAKQEFSRSLQTRLQRATKDTRRTRDGK